jgi:hypothetical protein
MKKINVLVTALSLAISASVVQAKISPAESEQLGKTLTPLGAEKSANADSSIPAWNGGLNKPIAGYQAGDHHPDPFSEDKVLFTIDSNNYQQYAQFLSVGQQALFKTYPDSFKMPIYQSRRTAAYPEYVYQATLANATRAELIEDGNGIKGAAIGIPFPIPKTGLEAIWNHALRYRGEAASRNGGQAMPTASGGYTFIGFDEKILFKYSMPDSTPEGLAQTNILFKFSQQVTSPARLKGTALLVHETMDQIKTPRNAWTYNTGQRRVRKAPNVAYDAPGTAADGLRTTDDFDLFNGSPNRYTWTLKGKQELYIPYNSYKLHAKGIPYDDILHPGHINPELTRFEKHRVWVVEANLKPDTNHIYKKRTFYIDEDSWQVHVVDAYDTRDQLYRVHMSYGLNYYEVPVHWSTLDVYHDLNSRRYLALGLDNNEDMYNFKADINDKDFTTQALRRAGKR